MNAPSPEPNLLDPKFSPNPRPVGSWHYEHAWRIFNFTQDLIRSTDQKTSMLLVMATLLLSFGANNLDRLHVSTVGRSVGLPLFFLSSIIFFFFALSTLLARHSGRPMREQVSVRLLFAGHILTREGPDEYRHDFQAATQVQALDDILDQIYQISLIANVKQIYYKRAWMALMIQLSIFLALLLTSSIFHMPDM